MAEEACWDASRLDLRRDVVQEPGARVARDEEQLEGFIGLDLV